MSDAKEEGLPSDGEKALDRSNGVTVARKVPDVELSKPSTDIKVDINRATKIPLSQLASIGAGFSSLSDALRTVTSTTQVAGEQLLRVTDKYGNPLDVSVLQTFNDGSGIMGSFRDAAKGFGQARFHVVDPQAVTTSLTVPYDPTTLFMAVALMEVNHRLDDIGQTQREMFDYLKNRDRVKLRGDLDTLRDVLDNYQFNWNNEQYKMNNHVLVQSIRQDAAQAIVQQRAEVRGALRGTGMPIHVDEDVRHKARDVRAKLDECRLSVYLFAYSSFLEVMLLENFDAGYLANVNSKIDAKALEYRMLYTEAYDCLEAEAKSSVRAGVLGGVSGTMTALGRAIEKTPVGDLTPIDEALVDAGRDLSRFNRDVMRDLLGVLPDACRSDVRPFMDGIEALGHLYNDEMVLLADEDAVYLLPVKDVDLLQDEQVHEKAAYE